MNQRSLFALCLLFSGAPFWSAKTIAQSTTRSQGTTQLPIKVVQPQRLPADDLPAARSPLGIPGDYKPWISKLKNGELLIVAFANSGKGELAECALFWRSRDGGRTWGPREERRDLHGREFALSCLADGTLIMTCHILARDVFNEAGHAYSKVFRSTDGGRVWSEMRIGPEGFPAGGRTAADWTAVEIDAPHNPGKKVALLGVSVSHGKEKAPSSVYLWSSRDSGATWDKSLNPDTKGWIDVDGFFCQSTTYVAASGRILHPVRVDRTGPHWLLPEQKDLPKSQVGDQGDRSMLWYSDDNGKTWQKHKDGGRFGTYGEMYPRFLRLADGRLLLTFTVRSKPKDGYPLGLRAILSYDDGDTWEFKRDRLVIEYQNQGPSGGSFGNTVQLADGTLVSCYSYRKADNKTHVEAVRWRLPPSNPN